MDYSGHYEFMYIIAPNLQSEGTAEIVKKVKDFFVSRNVTIHSHSEWGMRRLAYLVKKFAEGYYVVVHFQTKDQSVLKDLDYLTRTEPRIIRHLLTVVPKAKFMEDKRQQEAVARRKREEEARLKAEAEKAEADSAAVKSDATPLSAEVAIEVTAGPPENAAASADGVETVVDVPAPGADGGETNEDFAVRQEESNV